MLLIQIISFLFMSVYILSDGPPETWPTLGRYGATCFLGLYVVVGAIYVFWDKTVASAATNRNPDRLPVFDDPNQLYLRAARTWHRLARPFLAMAIVGFCLGALVMKEGDYHSLQWVTGGQLVILILVTFGYSLLDYWLNSEFYFGWRNHVLPT